MFANRQTCHSILQLVHAWFQYQWCNQDFFQDQDQDLNFKTKTKPSVHDQDRVSWLFCDVYERPIDRKAFIIFGRKRRRKWNSIYGRKRNENDNGHHFRPKKNDNESHLIILMCFFLFHTFSHQVSLTMRRQYLVQFRLFCRWSLLMGFDFPHVQCIDILVTFF